MARSLVQLGVVPALVWLLPASEYGVIVLLMPTWWIGQALFSLGASEILVRTVGEYPAECWSRISVLPLLSILPFTAAACILAFFGADTVLGIDSGIVVSISIFISAAQSFMACLLGILRGVDRIWSATAVLALYAVMPSVTGIAAAFGRPSASSYLGGYLAGMLGVTIFGLVLIFRLSSGRGSWAPSMDAWRSSIRLGIPLLPSAVGPQGLDWFARRLVLETAGLSALAAYGVAATVGNFIWNVIKSASQTWAPALYKAEQDDLEPFLRSSIRRALAGVALATGGLVLLGPLLELFLPNGYDRTTFTASMMGFLACATPGVSFTIVTSLAIRERATTILAWSSPLAIACAAVLIAVLSQAAFWLASFAAALYMLLATALLAQTARGLMSRSSLIAPALGSVVVLASLGLARQSGVAPYFIASAIWAVLALVVAGSAKLVRSRGVVAR